MDGKRLVETELRVRYAETDTMGVVYHANYLVWFEVGRGEFFRAMGQDYGEWDTGATTSPCLRPTRAIMLLHAMASWSSSGLG